MDGGISFTPIRRWRRAGWLVMLALGCSTASNGDGGAAGSGGGSGGGAGSMSTAGSGGSGGGAGSMSTAGSGGSAGSMSTAGSGGGAGSMSTAGQGGGGRGGAAGGQGGAGRGGAGGGSGTGGVTATACVPESCDPTRTSCACDPSAAPCNTCDSGQGRQLRCTCSAAGRWTCASSFPCGSSPCWPAAGCSLPSGDTTCEYCDAAGNRGHCQCTRFPPPGDPSSASWVCDPPVAGGCGVDCGSRKCLDGEVCLNIQYAGGAGAGGGVGGTGGTAVPGTPTCVAVPRACGSQQPSCACLATPYGCVSLSGAPSCAEIGPRHFTCLRPNG